MKLINKSRGTGKTMQLIYASAITGFRIITPTAQMANLIAEMAKDMGLNIPKPLSDIEYRNDPYWNRSHDPILIDECPKIIEEALELYFDAPVVAATMTVPIDDDCVPPTPKPLVFDHETEKVRAKTNRDVLNEHFGLTKIYMNNEIHLEHRLMVKTEGGEDIKFKDWIDRPYVEPKEDK